MSQWLKSLNLQQFGVKPEIVVKERKEVDLEV